MEHEGDGVRMLGGSPIMGQADGRDGRGFDESVRFSVTFDQSRISKSLSQVTSFNVRSPFRINEGVSVGHGDRVRFIFRR